MFTKIMKYNITTIITNECMEGEGSHPLFALTACIRGLGRKGGTCVQQQDHNEVNIARNEQENNSNGEQITCAL
jgi:hypothetical protein